jgi:hypothetical protein
MNDKQTQAMADQGNLEEDLDGGVTGDDPMTEAST